MDFIPHNPKVVGSNPAAATNVNTSFEAIQRAIFFVLKFRIVRHKKYRAKNAERIKEREKAWRKANPEKVREHQKRYWAKKFQEEQNKLSAEKEA